MKNLYIKCKQKYQATEWKDLSIISFRTHFLLCNPALDEEIRQKYWLRTDIFACLQTGNLPQ